MREKLSTAMKEAMKAREPVRLSTIRMVQAAIKDLDIANRVTPKGAADDGDIASLMSKMVKQREESAKVYDQGGRPELAAKEREEIGIISEFMPKQLSDDEVTALLRAVIAEVGAVSVKDMGKCMAALKERYPGQMDFSKASAVVKSLLG